MNNCMFIGRITKDIEIKETQNKIKYADLSIAIDNGKDKDGNKRPATFPNLRAWDKLAETLSKFSHKGDLIAVRARYDIEKWQNEQGENRYNHVFIIEKLVLLSNKPKDNHEPEVPDYLNQTPEEAVASVVNSSDPFEGMGQRVASESELPF